MDREEHCEEFVSKIESMFPDVPMIRTNEMANVIKDHEKDNSRYVLVDVRSQPEQNVSVLEGSVPLSQLDATKLPAKTHLITYCTIGFRACLEARQLKEEHPDLRVSCLDGIACYTHAISKNKQNPDDNNDSDSTKLLNIVQPSTGQVTNQVHTYNERWEKTVSEDFESLNFSSFMFTMQNFLFGAKMAKYTIANKFRNLFRG